MLALSLLTFIVKRGNLCQQPQLCVKVQLNVSGKGNFYHLIIWFWWSRSSVHWIFTSHWGAGV